MADEEAASASSSSSSYKRCLEYDFNRDTADNVNLKTVAFKPSIFYQKKRLQTRVGKVLQSQKLSMGKNASQTIKRNSSLQTKNLPVSVAVASNTISVCTTQKNKYKDCYVLLGERCSTKRRTFAGEGIVTTTKGVLGEDKQIQKRGM